MSPVNNNNDMNVVCVCMCVCMCVRMCVCVCVCAPIGGGAELTRWFSEMYLHHRNQRGIQIISLCLFCVQYINWVCSSRDGKDWLRMKKHYHDNTT